MEAPSPSAGGSFWGKAERGTSLPQPRGRHLSACNSVITGNCVYSQHDPQRSFPP